jgi:3-deoxy-D-manno-octulosonic-acid transferase
MQRFWQFCYSVFTIPLLWIALQFLGLFNSKVRRGIRGRRILFDLLARQVSGIKPGPRVWFHSSSMGEFEQAKPIIAELRRRRPDSRVFVTFFSPSGYEHSRRYPLADVVCYLPFDTKRSAQRFLDLIRPDAALMVRYDIWPNHIWELQRRGIPTMIANATMRRQTNRRIPLVRNFHHYVYDAIDMILTVSATDAEAFKYFSPRKALIETIGDTRYDQVVIRSADAQRRNIVPPAIVAGKKVIVAGSTWPEDEEVLLPAIADLQRTITNLLVIVVPHEPTIEHIENLERDFAESTSTIRFSGLNEYAGEPVIIVDSIGILLILYCYAHIAYIGGSFRQGIHNVLEAAVHGVPVVFGPRHRNSQEPLLLVERGAAFVVNNSKELHRTMSSLLQNESSRKTAGDRAAAFVQSHVGATQKVLAYLEPVLLNHSTPGATPS